MQLHYGVEQGSFLVEPGDLPSYSVLRKTQNQEFAATTVARGIAFAKAQDYAKANKLYDQAMEVDPDNVDARIAKGAA